MSKRHHHQNKTHETNRISTTTSIGPETESSESGFVPSYEDVQTRAYRIHQERGGSDLENWLEAERVLREEHQGQG